MNRPALWLSALGLATTLTALPAHAVGRLVDVQLIDRDSGATLPVVRHQGDWWVAGRPGARYAIQVRNQASGRVLGVMAVDGVNVISGETASWQQTGYVLSRRQTAQITGWRKSDEEVAAFHFTALPQSYAARTGRPDHVGVIGVAVFREKLPERRLPLPRPDGRLGDAAPAASAEAAGARQRAPASPQLGTGHGERESAPVHHTRFERRSEQPDELITLRYDSRENLVARGILPPEAPPRPQPFPAAPARYVPDPPA